MSLGVTLSKCLFHLFSILILFFTPNKSLGIYRTNLETHLHYSIISRRPKWFQLHILGPDSLYDIYILYIYIHREKAISLLDFKGFNFSMAKTRHVKHDLNYYTIKGTNQVIKGNVCVYRSIHRFVPKSCISLEDIFLLSCLINFLFLGGVLLILLMILGSVQGYWAKDAQI